MTDYYKGMPKTVRVGCYQFRIEICEFEDAESENTFGHMNPISQKIRIRPGMTAQNLANTFVHECMHAIYWFQACGHFSSDVPKGLRDIEEEYVTKGSNGLCAFIQDNPKTMAWIDTLLRTKDFT